MASSHKKVGRFLAIIIACANSNRVRLNRSATPFWDGEYGAVVSKVIPLSAAHFFTSSLMNSFPLSILIHFGHLPKCRCIFVRCSLMRPVASLFCFINRTFSFRVQLSTNEIYHLHFPMDSTLIGPHTSDITSPLVPLTYFPLPLEKACVLALPVCKPRTCLMGLSIDLLIAHQLFLLWICGVGLSLICDRIFSAIDPMTA